MLKGTLEAIAAIKLLGVEAKKIAKDGVSLADLPEAIELIKHIDVLVAAVKDINEIPAEIKAIDQAELIELGSALFDVFQSIKNA
jgi:hypothetical protein